MSGTEQVRGMVNLVRVCLALLHHQQRGLDVRRERENVRDGQQRRKVEDDNSRRIADLELFHKFARFLPAQHFRGMLLGRSTRKKDEMWNTRVHQQLLEGCIRSKVVAQTETRR